MVRCGATISVQMVRDPCEMVRDWCQMLRDRYEILRQWHEMVRDSTRCCKISASLRDGVRSVRGGAALRSVRDGAFLLSPSSLPILLPAPSFSSSQLLPPSPPLLLLHTVSIPAACWGSRICTCTPRHSTQQHTHKQHARHTCHTRNTYLPKLLSRGSPGGPPHVLIGGAFVCCAAGAQGPRLPPSNDALEASILLSRCTVDVRGCFNNFLLAVWLRHGIVWMPTTHCV